MKILHVITSLLPGGAEKLVTDLLPRFREKGCEAEIAVFNAVETPLMRGLENDGFKVHRFAPEGCNVYSLSNIYKLQRLLNKGDYDIMHTHNTACQLFGALCRTSRLTKRITTEHNTINRRRRFRTMRYTDRLMYSAYDKVVCISDQAFSSLKNFLGENIIEKCEVVHNGIDISRYTGDIRMPDPTKDIIVTMVAGFRKQKDQDTAIRAIASLPRNFKLRLIGDGARINEVKQLAEAQRVTDRVDFTGFRDDVADMLMNSDIVLMSSHYEGLSLSNIEGMASGRPFVASNVVGLREVTDGAGILFTEGDHEELAGILLRLAENSRLYTETATKCLERARKFDIRYTTDRYLYIYERLLSDNK